MSLALIASAWIMLASVVSAAQGGQSEQRFTEQITQTITKVRLGNSPAVRTKAAEQLAELTRKADSKKLDDKTVADLVSLLDASDDSVVYWVARCLGNLGSRANTAIPELQKKLAEVDCIEGSKTSASGIRFALSQLAAPALPRSAHPFRRLSSYRIISCREQGDFTHNPINEWSVETRVFICRMTEPQLGAA